MTTHALRAYRTSMGWTQADVAGLTGYSIAMISLVEAGKRFFSPAAKVHVAHCLGVDVSELFAPPKPPLEPAADAA